MSEINALGATFENENTMVIDLGKGRVRRFGLCKYNGKYGYHMPVNHSMTKKFLTEATKKGMIPHAKRFHYPQYLIRRIGTCLWSGWGLQWECSSGWFMLEDSVE
jgi:hypothetical protein